MIPLVQFFKHMIVSGDNEHFGVRFIPEHLCDGFCHVFIATFLSISRFRKIHSDDAEVAEGSDLYQ